jgi:hypothetical protein
VSQSIDLDLRGLRQAGERLENATKDWAVAYRLYVGAVSALIRRNAAKTGTRKRRPVRLDLPARDDSA